MKYIFYFLLSFMLLSNSFLQKTYAAWMEDFPVDIKVSYTEYIWRGFDLLPDDDMAVQADFYFDLGGTGLYVGAWCSYATDSIWDEWDEWDFYGGYNITLFENDPFAMNIDIGYTYFHFPEQNKDVDSQEISLALKLPGLIPLGSSELTPYATIYYSFAAHDHAADKDQKLTWYKIGLDFSTPLELTEKQTLDLYLETFANDGSGAFNVASGFSHIATGMSTTFDLAGFRLTPALNYQWTLEDLVNDEDEFWASLSASITF